MKAVELLTELMEKGTHRLARLLTSGLQAERVRMGEDGRLHAILWDPKAPGDRRDQILRGERVWQTSGIVSQVLGYVGGSPLYTVQRRAPGKKPGQTFGVMYLCWGERELIRADRTSDEVEYVPKQGIHMSGFWSMRDINELIKAGQPVKTI